MPAVTFVPLYLVDAFIFSSSVRSFTSWQHKMEGQRITKVPIPGKNDRFSPQISKQAYSV